MHEYEHHHHHDHDHHHGAESDAPIEKLLALMTFMVAHNESHVQELIDLAAKLRAAGKEEAYLRIMDASTNFRTANAQLGELLQQLKEEEK